MLLHALEDTVFVKEMDLVFCWVHVHVYVLGGYFQAGKRFKGTSLKYLSAMLNKTILFQPHLVAVSGKAELEGYFFLFLYLKYRNGCVLLGR